jgi:hypothetical protein
MDGKTSIKKGGIVWAFLDKADWQGNEPLFEMLFLKVVQHWEDLPLRSV